MLSALPVLILLAPGVLNAITFGEPDGMRHPYVGAIIFQTVTGYYSCSATLVSPTVLVTAAHCTSSVGVRNLNTWAKFTPTIAFEGYEKYSSLCDNLDHKKNGWIKAEAYPHPNYVDSPQIPVLYDVGVVVLRQAVDLNTYGSLPPEGFLSTIQKASDNNFTVVGYGLQGYTKPFYADDYARYQGSEACGA